MLRLLSVLLFSVIYYNASSAGSDIEMLVDAPGDRLSQLEAKVSELQQKLSSSISQNKNLHSQFLQLEESVRDLSGKTQSIEFHNTEIAAKVQNLAVDTNSRFEILEKKPKPESNTAQPAKNATAVLSKYLSMIEQQKYPQAISGLQKYIDANPKSLILGEAYYWLGYAYMSKGSFSQAIKLFMKSYNGFPKSSKAEYSLLNMGVSLEKLNEHDKACTVLQKLISTTSNNQIKSLANREAKNFLCSTSSKEANSTLTPPVNSKTQSLTQKPPLK